ncbi:MAG: ABC transporter substrate-binding protein [Acidimicrobiales bacterium]
MMKRHDGGPRSARRIGWRRWSPILIPSAAVAMLLSGCGGGASVTAVSSGPAPVTPGSPAALRGQTITVLVPSYAELTPALLHEFTRESGIGVSMQTATFTAIHERLTVAGASGTPTADVTEFDWSWTGQFAAAGWFVPLQDGLPASTIKDTADRAAFVHDGQQYAACYNNTFRIGDVNTAQLAKAHIDAPPATLSQLLNDAQTVKRDGIVQYPLNLQLSAQEGTVTLWTQLTHAMGGEVLNAAEQPVFDRRGAPASAALGFMVKASKDKLVSPAAFSLSNVTSGLHFFSGSATFTLAGGPGDLKAAANPSVSHVEGQVAQFLIPGSSGPGATIALPEGLGIPATSTHKQAALAFIRWWTSPAVAAQIYTTFGLYPCNSAALRTLAAKNEILGASTLAAELTHVVPTFPGGTPSWYSSFSTDAASLINSAAEGQISVTTALSRLASDVNQLRRGAG